MFDESGLSSRDDYFALAALVSDDHNWAIFSKNWFDVLETHRAPYLHMREFAHRIGVFKGWKEVGRRALMADCLDVLCKTPFLAFATAMSAQDYRLLDRYGKESPVGRLQRCFLETLASINVFVAEFQLLNYVNCVYSRQDDFARILKSVYSRCKDGGISSPTLRSLTFEDMRTTAALQAADLFAYEFRHYLHLRETRPDLSIRYPYRRILEHQRNIFPGVDFRGLKYLPGWFIEFELKGVLREAMHVITSDRDRWGHMSDQLRPYPAEFMIPRRHKPRISGPLFPKTWFR